MVDSISSSLATSLLGNMAATSVPVRKEAETVIPSTLQEKNNAQIDRGSGGSLEDAFAEINASMEAWATGMRFELDEETQRLVVYIIDRQSGDVLRQIPSDEVLHVAKMITQFQGTLIKTQA